MRRPAPAIRAVSRVNRPPPRTNPTATAPATIPYGLRRRRPSMSSTSPSVAGARSTAIIVSAPASRDARHEVAERDRAQQAGGRMLPDEARDLAVEAAEPPFRILYLRANAIDDILCAAFEAGRVHAASPCIRVISSSP